MGLVRKVLKCFGRNRKWERLWKEVNEQLDEAYLFRKVNQTDEAFYLWGARVDELLKRKEYLGLVRYGVPEV